MVWEFDHGGVLMHQGIGLDAFNALPERKAVHALYECCNSMTMAHHLSEGRAYDDHDALFRRADALLFALPELAIDPILDACPHLGRRPRSAKSQAEQCAVWVDDADVMAGLSDAARVYAEKFGFGFVMFVDERLREERVPDERLREERVPDERLREERVPDERLREEREFGGVNAGAVLTTMDDRMHNDVETERKIVRNELAKINRSRLERMLGPEGGYQNW